MRSICTLALIVITQSVATADPEPSSGGIGLGVGVATGPNLQLTPSPATQVDIGLGVGFDDRVRLQADHAWRLADLGSASVRLPLYLGVGGFVSDHRSGVARGGARMPLGLQADFARAPVQVFGELSPELVLVQANDGAMELPPEPLVLTGLMGVRAAF